jgi:hypothetical protein
VSESARPRLSLAHDVHLETAVPGVFLERALEQGLTELRLDNWPTAEPSLARLGKPALHFETERRESALYEWEGALVLVGRHGNHVHSAVAADTRERIEAIFTKLQQELRPPDPSAKHEVTVTFWTYGPHGPQQAWRSVSVPEWDEISLNYASPTRQRLDLIMRGFTPAHGGQLVLWRGDAGTGKTFALRALAWEWRDWCEFHYIVDPDSLFGEHADYLMAVLMKEGSPIVHMQRAVRSGALGIGGFNLHAGGDADDDDSRRAWRVLVLEDTGELLSAQARAAVGQGLSRFLNVVDGLIGQGLRVLVLVTTNEEIRTLHPAVARPGRAAANIEFVPLTGTEARDWLKQRGIEGTADGPATIASLYAQAEGRDSAALTLARFADESD